MKNLAIIVYMAFLINAVYSQELVTVDGEYKSIKGQMVPLSCYCYNGGIITYGMEETVNVCFDKLGSVEIPQGRLSVTGIFETVKHTSGENDPCPSGEMKVLMAEYYYDFAPKTQSVFDHWIGKWNTKYGELKIFINTNIVTGYYGKGTISGIVVKTKNGSDIIGNWDQNDKNGWFVFSKQDFEIKFTGKWGYGQDKSKVEGDWNGNLMKQGNQK